jgi:hypothetical protein
MIVSPRDVGLPASPCQLSEWVTRGTLTGPGPLTIPAGPLAYSMSERLHLKETGLVDGSTLIHHCSAA